MASPGSAETGLEKVRTASEPSTLTTTNVGDVLGLKGGTGASFVRLLKRLGMLEEGGRPTPAYRRFRGEPGRSKALAEAIRTAYAPLFQRVEAAHKLQRDKLTALVVEVTGSAHDARPVELTVSTFQKLCSKADFEGAGEMQPDDLDDEPDSENPREDIAKNRSRGGVQLTHQIVLHLPDTTDIRVFDAIFKSLRENLME